MGIFRFLWKTTSGISRTTFYLGGLYTFFAYFYVQQIKYRLGDSQLTYNKMRQNIENQMKSLSPNSSGQISEIAIDTGLLISQIYTFYARAWHFRQYEQSCVKFHKNVIKTILKNYESYGIFKHKEEIKKQIDSNNINPVLLKKIFQVRQVNQQFMMGSVDLYKQIVEKQMAMRTRSIIGLTESQKKDINLIYKYIQKGILLMASGNDKYWEILLRQSELKRYEFNDVIFSLFQI